MACALEETVTTRTGALCCSRSRSRLVSRNGARWLRAKVRSSPSAVTCRVSQYPPTLLTSTSIRERLWSTSSASRRTSDWEDRSATSTSTCPPPAARISRAAPSARPRSRPVIARCAPIVARPRAVALPMPPVPPVTSTVLPAIGPLWTCSMVVLLGCMGDTLGSYALPAHAPTRRGARRESDVDLPPPARQGRRAVRSGRGGVLPDARDRTRRRRVLAGPGEGCRALVSPRPARAPQPRTADRLRPRRRRRGGGCRRRAVLRGTGAGRAAAQGHLRGRQRGRGLHPRLHSGRGIERVRDVRHRAGPAQARQSPAARDSADPDTGRRGAR